MADAQSEQNAVSLGYVGRTMEIPDNPTNPALRNHAVNIRKVDNGFIIAIGCKTFVSISWDEVSKALAEYYTNPEEAFKKYCKQ